MTDLEKAVMDILWKSDLHSSVFKDVERCRKDIAEIQKRKEWARKLADPSRPYYLKWLDYFEREHMERVDHMEAQTRADNLSRTVPKYQG